MIKYSVIIPFHSNFNLLTLCLDALFQTLDPAESEIIIVDNNAAGSQIPAGAGIETRCRIIRRQENLMYPRAVNLGAENARGEYLLFCDADTCVRPDFHISLIRALSGGGAGYAAAKLFDMGTGRLLEFGITSSRYNFPHPFAGRQGDFALIQNDHTPLAGCAACSAIRKELFLSIGGFDPELVHSYSDIDLSLRLLAKGYTTICAADAAACHCGSSTVGSGMGASLKEDTKGIFMQKHPNIPVQIGEYLDMACAQFMRQTGLSCKEYFILDCSTIANSALYIDRVVDALGLAAVDRYRLPAPARDLTAMDLLNFIPYQIRNYRVPILYFTDFFLAFRENDLWKSCRAEFPDIVLDRHANLESLQTI